MKKDESFGIIPFRRQTRGWEIFLIQHNRGHYWGFPKGHAEEGESFLESAARELKEETNLDIVCLLQKEPFSERYQFLARGEKIFKTVIYFAAEVSGTVVLQSQEIQNGIWVPVNEALDKITHEEGKAILRQILPILSS